jgi:thiol-disulfide isomerase/thioredoxin
MTFNPLSLVLAIACMLTFSSCEEAKNNETSNNDSSNHLAEGQWMLYFQHEKGKIPVRFDVQKDSMTFYNAAEIIGVKDVEYRKDSVFFALPIFENLGKAQIHSSDSISGSWHRTSSGPDYIIPFYAVQENIAFKVLDEGPSSEPSRYEVTFFAPGYDPYPAIGQFNSQGNQFTGTFLTEMGDSRFLQGEKTEDSFWFSAFDGGHLVYFEGEFKGDSVSGNFLAGKEWNEKFIGVRNSDFTLTHPDSLTRVVSDSVAFQVKTLDNEVREFNHEDFKGQVTIIQIMGSWCPNCLDETRLFKDLYARYNDKGLEIIPVAFERGESTEKRLSYLERHKEKLEIPYDVYLGGEADKEVAHETFPFLSDITSFPTSIYIDKTGTVRKIHTGFYGPGTGEWYNNYTSETDKFIEMLLSEKK